MPAERCDPDRPLAGPRRPPAHVKCSLFALAAMASGAAFVFRCEMPLPMPKPDFPTPPLPKAGQQRAWWRAPASPSALAFHIAARGQAHDGPAAGGRARQPGRAPARDPTCRRCWAADARCRCCRSRTGKPCPTTVFSPHPDIVSQRLAALHRLPTLKRGIVVVPVQTLMQRLAPLQARRRRQLRRAASGQRLDLDAEKRRLESAGYRHVPQVLDPGDFAVRGGLLDVYPMGADQPFRIELLDDEIDTIRAFDPEIAALARQDRRGAPAARPRSAARRRLAQARAAMRCASASTSTRAAARCTRTSRPASRRPASSTTCRCSSTRPRRCSTTSRDDALPVLGDGALEAAEQFWTQHRRALRAAPPRPRTPAAAAGRAVPVARMRCASGSTRATASKSAAKAIRSATRAEALGDQPAPALPIAAKDARAGRCAASRSSRSYPGRVLIAADSAGTARGAAGAAAGARTCSRRCWRAGRRSSPARAATSRASRIAVAPLDDGFALTRAARSPSSPNASCSPSAPASRAAASASGANPKRSSATWASSAKARRSCTRTTASAATAA